MIEKMKPLLMVLMQKWRIGMKQFQTNLAMLWMF
jgi:hypothetical protein